MYITNSGFTRNGGGAVYIESNSALISNTEFNYNSAESWRSGRSGIGTVVITWCGFTNNEASRYGGAISVVLRQCVHLRQHELTNNRADSYGGAIDATSQAVCPSPTAS